MKSSTNKQSHELSQWLRRKAGSRLPFLDHLAASQTESRLYKPLNNTGHELRVIGIEPGAYGDDVRGTLIVTQVPGKPIRQSVKSLLRAKKPLPYEAISYCWGDPQKRTDLQLNGRSISAPASAVDALRRFRLHNQTRYVWIDALSINQDDLDERSNQVAMMGDIYRNAVQTLVYLDIDMDDNKLRRLIALLQQISDDFVGVEGCQWVMATYHQDGEIAGRRIIRARACSVVIKDEEYLALLNVLFENRWFSRLWVWQEVLLATRCTMHIKNAIIPWDTILTVAFWGTHAGFGFPTLQQPKVPIEWLPSYVSRMHMSWPSIVQMAGVLNNDQQGAGQTLEFLLTTSDNSSTTDPRDRVYALLGLLPTTDNSLSANIQPDYRKSIQNCMRDATRAIIADTGCLVVLRDRRLGADTKQYSEVDSWPSWVPVWCLDGSDLLSIELPTALYTADNGRALDKILARDDQDADTLLLKGFTVDTVTETLRPMDETFTSVATLTAFLDQVNTIRIPRQPLLSLSELVLILMVESMREVLGRVDPSDDRISSFDRFTEDLDPQDPGGASIIMNTTYTLQRLVHNCRAKALFLTQQGRIGVGPASIAVDDDLCILFGGYWPFVVRRMGDHDHMVGPCYTRGVIDGEAVQECEGKGEKPVVFRFR